jgi:hypothetical protein
MKRACPAWDAQEVEQRAAAIRRRWSYAERIRRTGLPPDMPFRLRDWAADTTRPQPLFVLRDNLLV